MSYQHDVVILGGGAGGLTAASGLAQLGLNVCLINKEPLLGGDCLHTGCVPSKTLINIAKSAHIMNASEQHGLHANQTSIDSEAVMRSVHKVIEKIQIHDSIERFEKLGVQVKIGSPKFIDKHTISLDGQTLTSKYIVIATGSSPKPLPIPGLNDFEHLTNESFFNLTALPQHLAIIGGGAIGCELAQALNRLGVQITLFEVGPQLLPFLDYDMSQIIYDVLESEGVKIHLNAHIEKIERNDASTLVYMDGNSIACDNVLVAAGRKPNLENLDLEKINLDQTPFGLSINQRCQTSIKNIFAVGDVTNSIYKFTHHAEYQASIVLQNIAFKLPKKMGQAYVPACVYTDPEVATIGISEADAKQQGYHDISTITMPFEDLDRAQTDYHTQGMGKLVFHKKQLIGVTLVGPHAGDMITEWRYVLNKKLKLADIASQIHPYPNYSQFNKRIAGRYFSPIIFSDWMKRLVKILHFRFS